MRRRLRKLRNMVFSRNGRGWLSLFRLGGTRFDYAKEVGDGSGSSLVGATLGWIARNFPEAPPAIWPRDTRPDVDKPLPDHPLLRLLERPNPFYSGVVLWMATIVDWYANGEAYWLKLRSRGGEVVELWWAPSHTMEPHGSEETFVTHYVYTVNGEEVELAPSEVVHFRNGLDPEDPKRGVSPLKAVLREIFTDDEAANFTASLLRNMGVPGILVAPDQELAEISEAEAEETKATIKAKFTGDKRGEPIVMTSKTKVEQFGFSPEELVLRELREIPEERVTAATGIPAVVVGFGAGLKRSTFTNMGEAREMAYENGLIPTQRILAEDVRWQLLPDFEPEPFEWRFGFDLTRVRVLQDDVYRQNQANDVAIRGGWMKVAEGRRARGLPVTDADEIYLRQSSFVEVPGDGGAPRSLAPSSSSGNGNGGGNGALAVEVASEVIRAVRQDREREAAEAAATRRRD